MDLVVNQEYQRILSSLTPGSNAETAPRIQVRLYNLTVIKRMRDLDPDDIDSLVRRRTCACVLERGSHVTHLFLCIEHVFVRSLLSPLYLHLEHALMRSQLLPIHRPICSPSWLSYGAFAYYFPIVRVHGGLPPSCLSLRRRDDLVRSPSAAW